MTNGRFSCSILQHPVADDSNARSPACKRGAKTSRSSVFRFGDVLRENVLRIAKLTAGLSRIAVERHSIRSYAAPARDQRDRGGTTPTLPVPSLHTQEKKMPSGPRPRTHVEARVGRWHLPSCSQGRMLEYATRHCRAFSQWIA